MDVLQAVKILKMLSGWAKKEVGLRPCDQLSVEVDH